MDISYWIQCNPKITVEHTAKKYFGEYLHKMVLYVPAGRLIHSKYDIEQELAYRKNYNPGGSWWVKRHEQLNTANADVKLLELIRDLKRNARTLGIKIRVEEPRIQLYATSDDALRDIIDTHLTGYGNNVESISAPEDDVATEILNSGAIIRKNDIGYRYKVTLRDGNFPVEIRTALYNYLLECGPDLIRAPKGTLDMLSKPSAYIWNCYFYTNDEGVTTMVRLMSPTLISNCHELVVLPHK